MRRLLLAIMFMVLTSVAHAACPSPLELQDANGLKAPAKYTDDGTGNCMPNVAIQGHGNAILDGTAGTPAAGVLSVQGVNGGTGMTISAATGSIAAGAATDGWNVTEGSKSDSAWVSGNGSMVALLKAIAGNVSASVPAGTNTIGFVSNDPCAQAVKSNAAIGTAGATNVQAVAGVSAKKVYICSLSLIAGAAAVFNVIEGTGSSCTSANEAAIIGSTTASSGLSLAANGGLTLGNGQGTIGVTATAANGVCILVSSSVQFGGNITYVQQ